MIALPFLGLVAALQRPAAVSHCALAGPPVDVHWSGAIPAAPRSAAPLRVVTDLPLPGSAARFDYQSLEPRSGRLFISHMGAGQLVVFDVRIARVLATLEGFPRVTGVLAVASEHRVYASAPGDHAVVVVDDSTLAIVARVPGPAFPDGIAYAPEVRRVFVSDESGGRDFVIDAATNAVAARIDLGGEAGNTQYDAGSHCVLVAVQTANQLAVIDPSTAQIVRRISFREGIAYPHGFVVDAPHRLAFVTGAESATVGVLDLETLQLRQVLPVGRDPDVLALDPGLNRLYVASESGIVAVFRQLDGTLVPLGWYKARQAHSVAVDPATHRLYLPLADVGGHPMLRVLAPADST